MKAATTVVALLLCVALAAASRQAFIEFQHKYNKVYSHEEFGHRYNVFQENLAKAARMNAGKKEPVYGVTKFSDLTPEEFKAKYLMKKNVDTAHIKAIKPAVEFSQEQHLHARQTSSFDWRDKGVVTPVYNQGQCGSCWAFSITEAIESAWAIAGNQLTSLSMQQVVDCDTSDDGCGGGDPPTAYAYVQQAGGLEPYSDYPYTGEQGSCQFNSADIDATISGWQYATQSGNEQNMATALVNNGPLSVCVDAESWQTYSGGIITTGDNCGTSLDHCVQAVGYSSSNGTPYWIVRNSWGTDWGINGYIYVQMGANVCGIAQEATYPTAS